MRGVLVVVDRQNDFIDGALGTPEAEYPQTDIFVTKDTHEGNYLRTQEGKYLPVEHCIRGTEGWEIRVDAACCAGVTPESHDAALTTMRSCQVQVTGAEV